MVVNEKALRNSYINAHLMGKDISVKLIQRCLKEGVEVTNDLDHTKEGSRYFCLEMPNGAGLPGRFVLPDIDGPLGGKVANWNSPCVYKFRHGKLAPVINRGQIPEWLITYASVVYVIIEKNELPDGSLQVEDGPMESDPEGSWLVATAHFGPPSRMKPRIPRDCLDPKALKSYLQDLDSWSREQRSVVFIDLEADGHIGPAEKTTGVTDELGELRRLITGLKEEVLSLRKQTKKRG